MPKSPAASCVPWMRPTDAEKVVHRLAVHTVNIAWSKHAREQMVARDILDDIAVEVLRTGYVKGEIIPGNQPGEWKAKLCKKIKGRREIGVVTLIVRAKRLFVKTVEWEDL